MCECVLMQWVVYSEGEASAGNILSCRCKLKGSRGAGGWSHRLILLLLRDRERGWGERGWGRERGGGGWGREVEEREGGGERDL